MTFEPRSGYLRLLLPLALFAFSAAGCGSDDDVGLGPDDLGPQTGVFLDSAVENLSFATVTNSGTTDPNGRYTYFDGELITFAIGSLEFPIVAASALTTPFTLAGSQSDLDQQTTNIARLLQSLDDDGDPSNGIRILDDAAAAASPIDFDVDTVGFESNPAVVALVAGSGGVNTTLISEEAARSHLTETITGLESGVVGAWSETDGPYFSHIVLFADGTFVYGENDREGTAATENGVEVGTYEYDPFSGTVTFSISFDENGPGTDSGIGDIGRPSAIDVVPTNGGTSLSVLGGALVLDAADLTSETGIAGAWRETSGPYFNYLVLYTDSTFLFATNISDGVDTESGLEVGTYVYTPGSGEGSASGSLTFNIVYDDNAPGEGAGVGDRGTPAVFDVQLSDGNNTLSTVTGETVLTRGL